MEKTEKNSEAVLNHTAVRWLLRVVRGKRRYVAALLAVQVVLSLASVAYSLLFRELVDNAVAGDAPTFVLCFSTVAVVTVFRLSCNALSRWLDEFTRAAVENILKHRLFDTLLRKDYAAVTGIHTGEWMNRLTSDTMVVANGLTQIIPNVGGMLVKIVGALVALVALEPLLGAVILPAGLILILVTRVFRPALKRLHTHIQQNDGILRVFLQERLDNLLIVTTFSQEDRSAELADGKMEEHRKSRMRRSRILNICNMGFGIAMHGLYLLGAGICGMGIIRGTVSFGTLTAVLQLIGQLQNPFAGFSGYLSQWYSMTASAERLMEAESFSGNREGEPLDPAMCLELYHSNFTGIRIENLEFSYAGFDGVCDPAVAIRDLSMELKKGEFISLVGPSGCGKSTLLKLLLCLYQPSNGRIRVLRQAPAENRDLTAGDRGLFAYVPQGNQLMSGTIRQVVAFDDEKIMRQETVVWEALRVACADDFVAALPQGLDTPLGEHGSGLSEGQIQRLAVARAICSRRPILLLDEATSSLDEDTEARLLENLRTMTDRTVLIITHRPRACAVCDRVVEMGNRTGDGEAANE